MKIFIFAIDKLKDKDPESVLIRDYVKRTRWPIDIREFEDKKNLPDLLKKEAESTLLAHAVPPDTKIVLLDEKGEEPDSRAFAEMIKKYRDGGFNIAFLIGGANGHADFLKKQADKVISFGRMTMPHLLARVVLAEQIYRAKTILGGHPYHKD